MPSFTAIVLGPLGILALSVGFIVLVVARLKLHAFFGLMLAALLVALLAAAGKTGDHRFLHAIDAVMTESGAALTRIGFPIALAAVIGSCLMESGAADKIVRRTVGALGENRAAVALLLCGFILSAPVFIDTVLMLLLPLARALSLRTGKDYLVNVLVICTGAAVSNGVVPPAPGPLFVAETLKINLGFSILAGIAFGTPLLFAAWGVSVWLGRRRPVPVRPTPGSTLDSLAAVANRPEAELPGLLAAAAPVLVPFALIAAASFFGFGNPRVPAGLAQWIEFFGNKNIALSLGALIALDVYRRQRRLHWPVANRVLWAPLETAGLIILIIAAGGAYGAMIKDAGVGAAVRALAGAHPLNYVLLAWVTSAMLRAAQGSATVATITAVGIMQSIAGSQGFGVHPLYILIAIGFGSKFLSWMNDSGFWLISRLGGLTQEETLRSWTVGVSVVSVCGLIEVLLVSRFFPHFTF